MLLRLIRDFWRQYGPSAQVPKRPPNELKRWNDEFRPAGEGLRSRLLEDLGRWIERHPRDAQAWAQRGDWLSRLHRYPEAEDDFRRALRLDPNFPAAQEGIGWVLLKLGRLDEAYLHLETAHKKQPGDADILVHWGLVCLEKGDLAQAGEKFQRAIDRSPRNAHAWHNLGLVALQSGDVTQGIAYIRRSIECDPMLGVAYSNLALACRDAQMLDAGLVEARRAVELKPDDARCRVILGDLLTDAGDFTAALQALDEAARLAPEDAGMRVGRGKLFMACGRYDEAVAVFELVLKSDPEDAEAAAGLGQLRLLQGRFGTGWALYDARRRTATAQMRAFRQPLWQGEELRGKTLLVHAEQGLGDIILFSSCLPDVISQAAHVIVETYPRLAALMQRSFPDATVVSHDVRGAGTAWLNALPPVDFQTPIGSLPRWLRPSRAAFSPHAGYLRADAGRVERLRHQLTQIGPGLKLGITWRGGLARTAGLQRSIELQGLLTTLAPLGAQLVSLQHDATAEEIALASEACGTTLTHWAEEVADQDAAAALTCALDAVVTVCQTQAHLTGALGRPGCVLVPRHPNWRYGLEGDSVPWYPDLHLLRQRDAGDWGPTLSAAAHWVTQRQSKLSARRAESKA